MKKNKKSVTKIAVVPAVVPPAPAEKEFPVVGIGASAGGLAAFEAFFSAMPADVDPGMAFVLVQHLAPDHKSILSELVRRYTRMQVFEVEDGMIVRPNCAYIIPPNRDMAFLNGALQLLEPASPRGQRLPIDFFFRSLAQDRHERAICIVLSGTGSDGTLGLRAIKGEGGMVMVQKPESTDYDGMPRSAIATGLVDFVLPPAEMPNQLIAYNLHAFGKAEPATLIPATKAENALKKIFILLRAQTRHDFSQYKPSTIRRRVERRMAVHRIAHLEDYVRHLQQTPVEVEALFRDLLIGVTNFFRDPDAFAILRDQVIPGLFTDKSANSAIRVWCPGCSTGEEAYSLAILLQEGMEARKRGYALQIFATDIDSQAIVTARAGLYPASIAADVSAERLARFFTAEHDGSAYRIHKNIRDTVVFSEQDVIRDPPFSKLDLISCRNLLIYMGGDLQKKLVPLFHYALNPTGFLFLGSSETVGEFHDLFAIFERKAKVYRRKADLHQAVRTTLSRFPALATTVDAALPPTGNRIASQRKLPLRELAERALLEQTVPAAAVVNAQGDILYLHGRTGRYLEPAPGEAGVNNILKMAREGLRRDLTMVLHKATQAGEVVRQTGLRVKTNGDFSTVTLTVCPLATRSTLPLHEPLYLVILEEAEEAAGAGQPAAAHGRKNTGHRTTAQDSEQIAALQQELRAKEEYLQASNEELETANEELKSANEEMQSVNEELQSTNEELETSKEELQSVNEELATVNNELQTKVVDLSRTNNDMNNLLAGTGIGTVFVDHQLRILRFTPAVTRVINLILSDVGRPVGHILANLVGYTRLVADVQSVLDTLVSKELDVQTLAGEWYNMRILPYRTLDNVIEGGVITFTDITAMKKVQATLRDSEALIRLAAVVRDSHDAITVQDLTGRILAWNPAAVRMYGWSEAEALTMNSRDLIPAAQRPNALARIKELSCGRQVAPVRLSRLAKNGRTIDVWVTATALMAADGTMYAVATTEREAEGER